MLDNIKITESRDVSIKPEPLRADTSAQPTNRAFLQFPAIGQAQSAPTLAHAEGPQFILTMTEGESAALAAEVNALQHRSATLGQYPDFHLQLGYFLASLHRMDEALAYFRQATQLSTAPIYRYALAEALLETDHAPEGHHLLLELSESGHIDATIRLAEREIESNRIEEARSYIDRALRIDSLSWKSNLLAGTLSLYDSKFSQAIRFYKNVLDERPNSAVAYNNMAVAYYFLHQTDSVLRSLHKAIAIDPWYENALLFLSDFTMQLDRGYDLPIHQIQRYTDFLPIHKPLLQRLAELYRRTHDNQKGIDTLNRIPASDRDANVLNDLGVLWFNKNPRRAQRYFHDALEEKLGSVARDTDYARTLATTNLVLSLLQSGDARQAEKLSSALLGDPSARSTLTAEMLGSIARAYVLSLEQQNKVDDAIRAGQEYFADKEITDSSRADIGNTLTILYIFARLNLCTARDMAEQVWSICRDITPHDDESRKRFIASLNNLVFVYLEREETDFAKPLLSKLSSHLHFHPFVTATFGLIAYRSGDPDTGAGRYREAIGLASNDADRAVLQAKFEFERARWCSLHRDTRGRKKALRKLNRVKAQSKRNWIIKGIQSAASVL